jgi:uncharacterized repeat protein (TIGR03803 family)
MGRQSAAVDPACTPGGCGTVFSITPLGQLTTLHRFTGSDGRQAYARLVQAYDGNLYGTTFGGGSDACAFGCGTVYRITLDGILTTLHYFDGADGANPVGGLIQAADGSLYGERTTGGAHNGGTVFGITLSGALATVYNFCAQPDCAEEQIRLPIWCKPWMDTLEELAQNGRPAPLWFCGVPLFYGGAGRRALCASMGQLLPVARLTKGLSSS